MYYRLFASSKRLASLLCMLAAFILYYSVTRVSISLLRCNPIKKMVSTFSDTFCPFHTFRRVFRLKDAIKINNDPRWLRYVVLESKGP